MDRPSVRATCFSRTFMPIRSLFRLIHYCFPSNIPRYKQKQHNNAQPNRGPGAARRLVRPLPPPPLGTHYAPSSVLNSPIARCNSTLASVSETHSKLSCICFKIPCRRVAEPQPETSVPVPGPDPDEPYPVPPPPLPSPRSAMYSPFRRERLETSVARGWRMRE